MADVKWIKLTVDFFDDEKILLIASMPDGYITIIVWVKLLCLAGKQNNSGVFKLSNGMPYTDKMLATIFRLDEAVVSHALNTFESFGMIQIVDGVITITNWGKHQNLDKIEASNEYMRKYMKEYRAKQKAIATGEEQRKSKGKLNSKSKIRSADEDLEKDQDKNIDTDIDSDVDLDSDKNSDTDRKKATSLDYDFTVELYHAICKSLPSITKLTDKRKQAILAAFELLDSNGVSFEQFFTKIENSDYLKGLIKDWRADFDWIMRSENIIKILSGLYDNRNSRKTAATVNYSDTARYENITMEDKK